MDRSQRDTAARAGQSAGLGHSLGNGSGFPVASLYLPMDQWFSLISDVSVLSPSPFLSQINQTIKKNKIKGRLHPTVFWAQVQSLVLPSQASSGSCPCGDIGPMGLERTPPPWLLPASACRGRAPAGLTLGPPQSWRRRRPGPYKLGRARAVP